MTCTSEVARFIAGLRYEDIPAGAVAAARAAMLDSVGVALAGSHDEAGRISAELVRAEGARDEATVWGHGFQTSATHAALVNGIATHALDFDASFTMMGQPMAGLTSTVLTLGEATGASGREALTAYAAGFELTGKVAAAMPERWGEGGWHATASLGTLGCTAAAARLLDLDANGVATALGIASSMAGGVVANFGTMSKPLHAGLAARNGIQAARLAQRGYSGSASTFDSPTGFFAAFAPVGKPNLAAFDGLGASWELERGVRFKAYPCGGLTHTAIDAALALRQEHRPDPDAIERVDVGVTSYTASRIVYRIPETELQGKFSMAYLIARALLDGEVVQESFSDQAIREPAALALAEKVFMEVNPEFDRGPVGSRPARVTIRLHDGRSLVSRIDFARGGPEAPLGDADLEAKFMVCARRVLDPSAAGQVVQLLRRLEATPDVGHLGRLLSG